MHKIRVTRIVARLNVGGPAVHIINLMAGLDPGRFESQLIVGRPGPYEGDMGYLAEQNGIQPAVIPELGRELTPHRDIQTVFRLVHILRRQRPHIVETHTAKAGAVGRLAARLAGVPVVIHVFHGHVFHSYFGPRKTQLFINIERALARFTDRIVTVSEAQYRDIVHGYRIAPPERVVKIPLGLNLGPFDTAKQTCRGSFRSSIAIPDDTLLVGFVGRLTRVKNPSLFIEAAQRVAQQIPQICFVFVGDGEQQTALRRRVAALGLAPQFMFAGWQKDMPAVYADLDLLALPSLNEGTPFAVIEALAAGTPVVATAVGGVPDILTHQKTGTLVPSGDAGALAGAIVHTLRALGQAGALARAGQRSVLQRFNLARLTNNMESLYLASLEEKASHLAPASRARVLRTMAENASRPT
jgi:glycosyltransferase involved in cell wall biosynthesis